MVRRSRLRARPRPHRCLRRGRCRHLQRPLQRVRLHPHARHAYLEAHLSRRRGGLFRRRPRAQHRHRRCRAGEPVAPAHGGAPGGPAPAADQALPQGRAEPGTGRHHHGERAHARAELGRHEGAAGIGQHRGSESEGDHRPLRRRHLQGRRRGSARSRRDPGAAGHRLRFRTGSTSSPTSWTRIRRMAIRPASPSI